MANCFRLLYAFLCYFVHCEPSPEYPFRNPKLPWDDRVDDLVSRLTLDEVILQLSKGGAGKKGGPAPAIPRLGIKPYQWNTECLRGDAQAGNATAFPQALNLASSWNPDLLKNVSEATSVEVRAKYNDYASRGIYTDHTGISCFSPVVNIMRDPLWGRNQETYGEDPYLTGFLVQYFIKGLHGENDRYVRASSGCKHFDVHGGPEKKRFSFNAQVSDRDWALTFQPAFKKCVQAGTYSVMCSYNRLNGVPACINKKLLTDLLRTEWGFKGYVISDEMAIENIMLFHRYLMDPVEVAARCVEAGTNIELSGPSPLPITYSFLTQAVQTGRLKKDLLYERAKPLFYTRMRLGEFDPVDMNPYNKLNLTSVLSVQNQYLTRKAASQSFVLLKNLDEFLPLKNDKVQKLTFVGPLVDNAKQIFGDYDPEPDSRFIFTPFRGLKSLGHDVASVPGCVSGPACILYNKDIVIEQVKDANLTIVCLGTGWDIERESVDRNDMNLPGFQGDLLKTVIDNSGGPVILLLFSMGPLDISAYQGSEKVKAILQCGFPAQAAGLALLDTLTNYSPDGNPAARLPYTWYQNLTGVPDIRNYTMSNRTYRYFDGTPLYPFGYGLSYTKFRYSNLVLSKTTLKTGEDLIVDVKVRNIGKFTGDEVVQVYVQWLDYKNLKMPQLQLVGFRRIGIEKGRTVSLSFVIKAEQMAVWMDGKFVEVPGHMTVFVGGQQPNQSVKVDSNVLSASFTILLSEMEGFRFTNARSEVEGFREDRTDDVGEKL